jgi:hypothetical protein
MKISFFLLQNVVIEIFMLQNDEFNHIRSVFLNLKDDIADHYLTKKCIKTYFP